MRRHFFSIVFALCLLATVLPLWVATYLPAVDLPQHLFLIHVLAALDDPGSPYHAIYVARPGLTYLTFYYSVRGLAALVGVEVALKVFLTVVLAGIPLSLLVLLRALGRSKWLALLACPLAYTDNFYWGLVSFQASIPLTLLVLAFFIRSLEQPADRHRPAIALALSLVALQLTHGAGMIFPAAALPLLLLVTPSDFARRRRTLLALLPGVALFLAWLLSGVNSGRQLGAPGEPWKASAPLFDPRNFVFAPPQERASKLTDLLANGFWAWADRPALYGVAAAAAVAIVLAAIRPQTGTRTTLERLRPALLCALALGFYFLLPSDITGYMYYIYPRYAQVAALLAVCVLPMPQGALYKPFAAVAAGVALYAGVNLAVLFHRFDQEAQTIELVQKHLPAQPRLMHLVVDHGSRHATHAVYLHYAALAAMRTDGVPSFSLAIDPSFPVGYREGGRPPAPEWEWRPQQFDWNRHASWYTHYLARGDFTAEQLFGRHARDVELVATADRWKLFARRTQ
ncbi:MAG: hypothetical protein ACK4N5_01965 [Myxococcales bacterium]